MGKLLVITNDFPPRTGGIQNFVYELLKGFDPQEVVVYCSNWRKAKEFDLAQNYKVIRVRSKVLLPTAKRTKEAIEIIKRFDCDRVLFGASTPLGVMAPALRKAGIKKIGALTHGHEAGLAGVPILRQLVKKAFQDLDFITYLGDFTRNKLARLIPSDAKFVKLSPGVDTAVFNLQYRANRDELLARNNLSGKKIVFCASRLMPRKGQDELLEVWPKVLQRNPSAHLLFSGGGPYKQKLLRKVNSKNLQNSVTFLGTLTQKELAAFYGMSNVFAMPNRTRNFGLDVEGLGMVFLEAAACGIPTIGGRAGGVPDALIDAATGYLVNPKKREELLAKLDLLLQNPNLAKSMGSTGRDWVVKNWQWASRREQLKQLLEVS
ncbi:MAG: glycosyltransferase family 4 protein [Candidatus Nanopelagicales bacterium]